MFGVSEQKEQGGAEARELAWRRAVTICGARFPSSSNADECSRIENVQHTSADDKKGYRIVTARPKCCLFHSPKELKEELGCFP